MDAKKYRKKPYAHSHIIFSSEEEKQELNRKAKAAGFSSVSQFCRYVGLSCNIDIQIGRFPIIENLKELERLFNSGFITSEQKDRALEIITTMKITGKNMDTKDKLSLPDEKEERETRLLLQRCDTCKYKIEAPYMPYAESQFKFKCSKTGKGHKNNKIFCKNWIANPEML